MPADFPTSFLFCFFWIGSSLTLWKWFQFSLLVTASISFSKLGVVTLVGAVFMDSVVTLKILLAACKKGVAVINSWTSWRINGHCIYLFFKYSFLREMVAYCTDPAKSQAANDKWRSFAVGKRELDQEIHQDCELGQHIWCYSDLVHMCCTHCCFDTGCKMSVHAESKK